MAKDISKTGNGANTGSGVMKFKGSTASLANLKEGLSKVVQQAPRALTDPLMRLLKSGRWVYGQENFDVEEGSTWAVNPFSIQHGYACWTRHDPKEKKKDELIAEVMVPVGEEKPPRTSLTHYEWPWADQISFDLQCVSGEDQGATAHYKTTSVGGIRAATGLLREIGDRASEREGVDETVVPVIKLELDSYQHKSYGETFVPIFTLTGWIDMDGNEPSSAAVLPIKPGGGTAAQPAAAKPARKAAKPAVEPEDDDEPPFQATPTPPVRRRRMAPQA